jgi:hypothetical protein
VGFLMDTVPKEFEPPAEQLPREPKAYSSLEINIAYDEFCQQQISKSWGPITRRIAWRSRFAST